MAALTVALEALQAEVRAGRGAARARCATDHYAAGDALHERAGGVLRGQRRGDAPRAAACIRARERNAAHAAGRAADRADRRAGRPGSGARRRREATAEAALARRARGARTHGRGRAGGARPRCRRCEAGAGRSRRGAGRTPAADRADRAGHPRRRNAARQPSRTHRAAARAPRATRRGSSRPSRTAPSDALRDVEEQLAQETRRPRGAQKRAWRRLRRRCRRCRQRQRAPATHWQRDGKTLGRPRGASPGARRAAGEDRPRRGHRRAGCDAQGPRRRAQLWQVLDIEPGWEDALEAVLRERLNAARARATSTMRCAWLGDAKRAAGRASPSTRRRGDRVAAPRGCRPTRCWPRCASHDAAGRARSSPTGCAASAAAPTSRAALADRDALRRRRGVRHAAGPSRQRARRSRSSRPTASCTASSPASASSANSTLASPALRGSRQAPRASRSTRSKPSSRTQQQRLSRGKPGHGARSSGACHDLELELLQLRQEAEAAARRRVQIAHRASTTAAARAGRRAGSARCRRRARSPTCSRGCTTRLRGATPRATRATKPRSRWPAAASALRVAERAAQEAGFAERSCRDRMAELERRARGAGSADRAAAGPARAARPRASSRSTGRRSRKRCSGSWARAARPSRRWRPRATALEALGAELRAADEARLAGRAEARACAREDPGDAAQGAGGRAGRAAVHRAAGRSAGRRRRAAGGAEGLGQRAERCRPRSSA